MARSDDVKTDSMTRVNPLLAKLGEVFNARRELDGSIDAFREWFNHRQPGEECGIRLLGCLLWASDLQTKLIQAQVIVKGEEY